MSINKTIENARLHLATGNSGAYARVMSGAIRAAMSDRAIKAYRKAIADDKAEGLFIDLATSCPLAREG